MATNDGGPAFPGYTMHDDGKSVTVTKLNPGMDLRDYFAAKVLGSAVLALTRIEGGEPCGPDPEDVAKLAYQFADAMLKARK